MNARQYIVKMMNGSGASRVYHVNTSNEISAAVIAETVCDGWTASGVEEAQFGDVSEKHVLPTV